MTVATTTTPRVQYNGNGVTVNFSTSFVFVSASDLEVTLTNTSAVDTILTRTTHYSVTGGSGSTGTITMVTAPAVGEKLTIVRRTSQTQDVDYLENDAFPAATHEAALDKLTLIAQELKYDLSRALLAAVTSEGEDIVFPTPSASALIGWDGAGSNLANYTLSATSTYAFGVGTGILVQTALSTAAVRTLTGTSNEITVTNGSGVSGNPTFSLASTLDLKSKTITVQDNNFSIVDNTDNTKILNLQLSGITTGTTRTLTIPNASGTIALTSDLAALSGDVAGPSSATNDAIVRFDSTSGKLIQNSVVTVSDNGDIVDTYTDNGSAAGPNVTLLRDSISPAGNDVLGKIVFSGKDSATNTQEYSSIYTTITSPTSTSESGAFNVSTTNAGTSGRRLIVQNDGEVRTYIDSAACAGVVESTQWCQLTVNYTLTSSTSEQKCFNHTTNGTLTLPTGVYAYEAYLLVSSMDAGASSNLSFDPIGAGTAGTDRWMHQFLGVDGSSGSSGAAGVSMSTTQQSIASLMPGVTSNTVHFTAKGVFRISTAGTIIPSVTLAVAAAAVVNAGSWFRITRIGDSGENYVGNWS